MTKNIIPCTKPTHGAFIDLTGMTFNRLTVTGFAGYKLIGETKSRRFYWECACQCGNEIITTGLYLKEGHTRSCGCFARENTSKISSTHKMSGEVEYKLWKGMTKRCRKPFGKDIKNYKDRGITVTPHWLGKDGFQHFFDDLGIRPTPQHSLERHNNNNGYCPCNTYYGTLLHQANNKRSSKFITYKGVTKTYANWERHLGFNDSVISDRINRYGWTSKEAIETPLGKHRKKVA